MRRLWLTLLLLCWAATGAQAGPNEGGTLVWHLDPGITYTTDITNYCGLSGIACERDFNGCPYDFEDQCQPNLALANPTGPADSDPYVAYVLAAFPEGSCPRLSGVTFGLGLYDDTNVFLTAFGHCGDFELATGAWPGQLEGTAVTFQTAIVSQLVELYWFAAYGYYGDGDGRLPLAPHPTQGGNFADDAVPSNLDPIAGFSILGLNGTQGTNILPVAGPATGACCFEDGSCQALTADDCSAAGGSHQGDDTVCDPNPCPQPPATGACCFEDGSCQVLTADDCSAAGGSYLGDDTVCDPNPCPQPPATGACCFEDGSCQVLTADDCSAAGGSYLGDDTVCDPNPCPQPPATGACCFEDGSCQVLTADDCSAAGGSYQGDDTVCDPNPCPQPPATGACCFEDGSCLVLTQEECEGPGERGDTPPTHDALLRGTGTGEYQGDGTTCDPNPCPQPPGSGACCFEDGSCQVLTSEECAAAGGDYQGNDTVCDPNPCPQPPATGACCFEDGSCQVLTADECSTAGGDYRGDDTVCDPNPCPQPPTTGACCFEDGSCQVLTADDCGLAGGDYQGDETVCDPNPCPQPPTTGACCFEDGSCQVLTAGACDTEGGNYLGDDTVCDPNPCPQLGALDITATISGHDAVVDVEVTGPSGVFNEQTPVLLEDLIPGQYTVEWVKPGHGGCKQMYDVLPGETTPATCALLPYYVDLLSLTAEAVPNRLDLRNRDQDVTFKLRNFSGQLTARSFDLRWIYLNGVRLTDANPRIVGLVNATVKGEIHFTVDAGTILDAIGTLPPNTPQQTVQLDLWTRLSSQRWIRTQMTFVVVRSSNTLANLPSSGAFGAVVRPNPARESASIEWSSPVASQTDLAIYDATGRVLRRLVSENRSAGLHQAQWDGRDADGVAMPSGVYYYRLILGETGEQISDKIYLVR